MRKPLHRTHRYARDVLNGKIVAGPLVRLACERHERDLKQGKTKGFHFHEAAANHAIDFIEKWVRLPDTVDEHGDPTPFQLQPWQAFIVGSLFGWKWTATGHRRYRNGYIEIGKGNGKTPMLAAIGLYGLMMDGQQAPEIYAAAADRDQAMIMFRDAVRMVDASPELAKRVQKSGIQHVHNMAYGLGFFRPFSREQGSRSGTRPHMGLIDEVHEATSADIINKIRAGAKGNMDAMFLEITNSGTDRTSICFQHHEHSRRIVEGAAEDERWFAYVCSLDEGDDPLTDDACWPKVNPNLGVSIDISYLRDQVSAAKHIPAETNTVLRLNFCVWTNQVTRAIAMETWTANHAHAVVPAAYRGQACYGGLDLASVSDLTAWVKVFDCPSDSDAVDVVARFWAPEDRVVRGQNAELYAQWVREGVLETTPGAAIDYGFIRQAVLDDARTFAVVDLNVDRLFQGQQLASELAEEGLTVLPFGQGFLSFAAPMVTFFRKLQGGRIHHGNHPILRWMADNLQVKTDPAGNMKPDKEKSLQKIDGIVALVMALDRWERHQQESSTPDIDVVMV